MMSNATANVRIKQKHTCTHLYNLIKYHIYCPFTVFCIQVKLITQHSGEGILGRVVLAVDAGWGGGGAAEVQ